MTRCGTFGDPLCQIDRQRTTPWTAGICPLSIMRAMAWRVSLSLTVDPATFRSADRQGPAVDATQSDDLKPGTPIMPPTTRRAIAVRRAPEADGPEGRLSSSPCVAGTRNLGAMYRSRHDEPYVRHAEQTRAHPGIARVVTRNFGIK